MLKIAVDFDGTIVDNNYPDIGKPKLFAFETLKTLQRNDCQLILWTYRSGKTLEEAIDFCREKGIEFYAVNNSYPEETYSEEISRKINVDIFIDDKNLGGFPGWSEVWQEIAPIIGADKNSEFQGFQQERKTFIKRLFKTFF